MTIPIWLLSLDIAGGQCTSLEKEDLLEYESKEKQIAKHQFDISSQKEHENEKLSRIHFYPELQYLTEEKRVFTSWIKSSSILVQLPFYDAIILPISPYRNHTKYRMQLGVTVEQTIELTKKGKIVPILARRPTQYVGLDYLDDILVKNPPSKPFRQNQFDKALLARRGLKQDEWFRRRSGVFKTLSTGMGRSDLKDLLSTHKIRMDLFRSVDQKVDLKREALEMMSAMYADICLAGYESLAEEILHMDTASKRYQALRSYSTLVYIKPGDSIDGIQTWTFDDLKLRSRFTEPGKDIGELFPQDIGKQLTKGLNLVNIKNVGFDVSIEICNETQKARRALHEMERAVERLETEKMMDRAHAVEEVMSESDKTVRAMVVNQTKTKKLLETTFIFTLGVVGALAGSFGGFPGIITGGLLGLGSFFARTTVAERSSNVIQSLLKPCHVVTIFKLQESSARARGGGLQRY